MNVLLELWSLEDFGDSEVARTIVSDILSQPEDIRPSKFGVWEANQAITSASYEDILTESLNRNGNPNMGHLTFRSDGSSCAEWQVSWKRSAQQPRFHSLGVWVTSSYVQSVEGRSHLLLLAETLCDTTKAVFARILPTVPEKTNAYSMVNLKVRLPEPCWVQYFGTPYLDLFGRDRLLSTPCAEVKPIGEHHIRMTVGESPFGPIDPQVADGIRNI